MKTNSNKKGTKKSLSKNKKVKAEMATKIKINQQSLK